MQSICIVFTGQQYVAWEKSGVLDNLKKYFKLEIILVNSQQIISDIKSFHYGNPSRITKWLCSVNQVAKRNRSKTFNKRFKRLYFSSLNLNSDQLTINQKIIGSTYIFKQFVGYSRKNFIQTLSFIPVLNQFFYKLLMKNFKKKVRQIQSSQYNFIKDIKSQIIMFPSTGAEEVVFELFELAKYEGKETLMVIENWDNLTSKTSFSIQPNFITVMGEKSKSQAHQIHEIPLENIVVTGLPKFEKIIEHRKNPQIKCTDSSKLKILYLGYSLPYNENKVVKLIYDLLLKLLGSDGFEFTYRAHPFKQTRFFEEDIAIPLSTNFITSAKNSNNLLESKMLPSIDLDYVTFLNNFNLIVTTPTTMVLEIMLLGIPCLVDGLDDGIHTTAPYFTLTEYLHQEDLQEIPELQVVRNNSELIDGIKVFLDNMPLYRNYSLKNILELDAKFSDQLIKFLHSRITDEPIQLTST